MPGFGQTVRRSVIACPVGVGVGAVPVAARAGLDGCSLLTTSEVDEVIGPHLHFQVMDRPSIVFSDGLTYVLDRFDVAGQTPPLPAMLRYYDTLEPVPVTWQNAGPRRNALPLGSDIVKFPPALR